MKLVAIFIKVSTIQIPPIILRNSSSPSSSFATNGAGWATTEMLYLLLVSVVLIL
jgi:hypothetical protein